MKSLSHTRHIRSYVRRQSRGLSASRQLALQENWPQWGLSYSDVPWDFDQCFVQKGPLVVEVGFGMGSNLLKRACEEPDARFVGIEVHRPGIAYVLKQIEHFNLTNIRIIEHDAVEALQHGFFESSIDRFLLYFPDPWPKKKHHKRRLVQSNFIELLASRMAPEGLLHLATDWPDYAEQMLQVVGNNPSFQNYTTSQPLSERPAWRLKTKFEKRGEGKGHPIYDLVYKRSN